MQKLTKARSTRHADAHGDRRRIEGALRGRLTLAQAARLGQQDLEALAEHGEQLRRRGALEQAAMVYELLVAFDPQQSRWWHRCQDLQYRCGNVAASMMAYHMLELLGAVDAASRARAELCKHHLGLQL